MDVLKFFNEAEENGILKYVLSEEERKLFLESLPDEFRLCYISKNKLSKLAKKNKISKQQFFNEFCIPVTPEYANVRSGDFGEMLCLFLIKDRGLKNGYQLTAPRKWRWKENKNHPCHGSDVVLFHKNGKDSSKDRIEVVESKMKSVPSGSSPIQNAVNGAVDDKTKRLAKTLVWMNDKFAMNGKKDKRDFLKRFMQPDEHGTYNRKFHAIAIIDDGLVEAELAKDIQSDDADIEIAVVSMNDLKTAYEETFDSMVVKLA